MLIRFVHAFRCISKGILSLASASMCVVSVALIISSVIKTWTAVRALPASQSALLESVSLIVISVAIIDVAKYILEEEVLRDRELREPAEAREAITKFIVVVGLVIAIESIVFIFNFGHTDPQNLRFPALLIFAFIAMIVGLGVYQKLSIQGELQLAATRGTPREDAAGLDRPAHRSSR